MKLFILAIMLILAPCAALAQAPHEVLKSRAAPNFDAAVKTYANELADWRTHMARVEQDKKNNVPKDKAYAPFPAPTADPEVMASIDAGGAINYKIINDDPSDDHVLAAKKAVLLQRVAQAADAVIAAISPAAKRPLANIRENEILQADATRMKVIMDSQKGILPAIGIGSKTPAEMQAEVAKARPVTDTNFLQDQAEQRQKTDAISRAAAQAMSDIEDLTLQNVDAYVMAPLPN